MKLRKSLVNTSLVEIFAYFVGLSIVGIGLMLILLGRPMIDQLMFHHLYPQVQTIAATTQILSEEYPQPQESSFFQQQLENLSHQSRLAEISILPRGANPQESPIFQSHEEDNLSTRFQKQIQFVQETNTEFNKLIWISAKPTLVHIEPLKTNPQVSTPSSIFIAIDLLSNSSKFLIQSGQLLGLIFSIIIFQGILFFIFLKKSTLEPLHWIEKNLSQCSTQNKSTPLNTFYREIFSIQQLIEKKKSKDQDLAISLKHEQHCAEKLAKTQTQLEQKSRALDRTKSELEIRVATRTAELTTTLFEMHKMQTNLLSQEQQLKHDALHDRLTGLPNRHYFHQLLQKAIAENLQDEGISYAVLYLDLDHFKVVNDSLGHTLGDQFLQLVAQRLQRLLRSQDKMARLGGDEFAILLKYGQRSDHASRLADRLIHSMRTPFQLNTYEAYSGVSIGITYSNPSYQEPESILRDADIAMYRAKRKGRGQYVVFDDRMKTQAMRRLRLENDLRRAIANQEFQLFYHPIVSIQSNKLSGFEGLARWIHPEEGFICPTEFIPIAEEVGLIHELGIWALEAGCQQLKEWDKTFPESQGLTISINLSPIQLQQSNLWEKVNDALTQSGLPGYRLKLEITESSILTSPPETVKTLNRFKQLGIQLCIDDFGMGHSSLQRLHELPIDILKIDRTFISSIAKSHADSEVVRMIMALAHGSNMAVVAEGVEESNQLEILKSLNCEWGQGFLYAEPMSHDVVEQDFFPKYLTTFEEHIARLHLAS